MKAIIINKRLAVRLGYDSVRELMTAVGQWLYTTDFTYIDADSWSAQQIMRQFIKHVHEDTRL
jgi:hypothetical protein